MILVVAEHDRGTIAPGTLEAMTAARQLGARLGATVHALTIGDDGNKLSVALGDHGAATVHQAHHELLTDYGPELWGATVARAVEVLQPRVLLACGTDRGNEVLAHAAARLDLPFAANCVAFDVGPDAGSNDDMPSAARAVRGAGGMGGGRFGLTRVRWGGSLLEDAVVCADIVVASIAHHSVDAAPADPAVPAVTATLPVELDDALARSRVAGRVEREAGLTLATAPVVVGGGRGVGSAEGFAVLEELAAELGGVVGCSRAVTNNGWRNHTDQVGQTGTRIAPQVYLACGISGAIQHWVGAMASKTIVAVNTDPEANMVTKAGYAVIGDLHEVVPAVTAEIIRRRRGDA